MATFLLTMKDKLRSRASSKSSRDDSNERSIPPEPVQQHTEGDFSKMGVESALQALNLARVNKQGLTLHWDGELANDASRRAEELVHGANGGTETIPTGETVFVTPAGATEPNYEDAVESWLSQEPEYNGEPLDEQSRRAYGQYTQCMWQSSDHIGMAKKKAQNGKWFVVARFSPPGNVLGEAPF